MNQRKNLRLFFNPICLVSIALAVLCLFMPVLTFAD
jgi:hypothetical protein